MKWAEDAEFEEIPNSRTQGNKRRAERLAMWVKAKQDLSKCGENHLKHQYLMTGDGFKVTRPDKIFRWYSWQILMLILQNMHWVHCARSNAPEHRTDAKKSY